MTKSDYDWLLRTLIFAELAFVFTVALAHILTHRPKATPVCPSPIVVEAMPLDNAPITTRAGKAISL